MTMSAGTEIYNADVVPVTTRGSSYTDEELDDALTQLPQFSLVFGKD